MAKRSRKQAPVDVIRIRGLVHMQIVDKKTGEIVGESITRNLVTNNGKELFIVRRAGNFSSGLTIGYLALATQTASTAAADNSVLGEQGGRKLLNDTSNTASNRKLVVAPGTLRMIASWDGTDLGGASPQTIGSIACFNTDASGSMLSAAQYTTSQWTSDQNVNCTYELQFS